MAVTVTNDDTVNGKIRTKWTGERPGSQAVFHDPLGSVVGIYEDGWLKADRVYDASGETRAEWNDVGTFGWVGGYGYRETRREWVSHYVRARHYSYMTGGWTSVDPLWPSEMAYGYVDGRQTTRVDPSGMLVEVFVRPLNPPVPVGVATAHWFFNTSSCGARGYESGGLLPGWNANAGGMKVNCYLLTLDPQVEACICAQSQSTTGGGGKWLPGVVDPRTIPVPPIGPLPAGNLPLDPGGDKTSPKGTGGYDFYHNNCQDFVQKIVEKCMGGRLDWPEMPGSRPSPSLPVIKCGPPSCPKR